MSRIVALARASWVAYASYRVQLLLSLGALAVMVVPIYFVAEALQPVMGGVIRDEADHAFGFLLVGMATYSLVAATVTALPQEVGTGIRTGTLEAQLATPTPLPALLLGLTAFGLGWAALRAVVFVGAGWVLGADLVLARLVPAAAVLVLIVAAHLPFGLMAAAMVIAFRTAGPVPKGVLVASGLLGGVYYPTHVIPSWIESVSAFMPLTYGLRALRRVLLQGDSLMAVAGDLAVLTLFGVALLALGAAAVHAALRYARDNGTLAQY